MTKYRIFACIFFVLWPILCFAEEFKVFSASEIKQSEGKFCSSKSLVDIHAHAACLDDGGKTCYISSRMKKERVVLGLISKYNSLFSAFGVSKSKLEDKGGEYFFEHVSKFIETSTCVESAVLLALDGTYSFDSENFDPENTDFMIQNDFVHENVRKFPNLLWAASVHPFRKDFREELAYSYKNGAVLIKLIPPIQGVPFGSSDKQLMARFREYFELIAKYKLPLLVHVDEEGTFSKELEKKFREYVGFSGIEMALDVGVTVIVAHVASRNSLDLHAGNGNSLKTYDFLLKLMAENKYQGKLYADISALPTIVTRDDHLCQVVKDFEGREDRLLWGSDYPLNHWKTTSTIILGVDCERSYLGMKSDEGYVFSRNRQQWDRAIFLQKNMGVKDTIFSNTKRFFVDRKLVKVDDDGRLGLDRRGESVE